MRKTTTTMSLTPELVALCHRVLSDTGPEPGLAYLADDDYDRLVAAALSIRPAGTALWLFAYGSLIWKPEIEHVDERLATVRGYHRAFRIRLTRWRGTMERPGLMMGLSPGGQCRGVAFRLPDGDAREQLAKLFRREMTAKPTTYVPKWLRLDTAEGPLTALGFVTNPLGRTYAGKLDDLQVATALAEACGHLGSGADYLLNTVANLESRGIRDRGLWRLQAMVAQVIKARA